MKRKYWKYWTIGIIAGVIATAILVVIPQFYVSPPAGLINFNNRTMAGWTVDGIYDGDTSTKIFANVFGAWKDDTDVSNEPTKDPKPDNNGSIGFLIGNNILTKTPASTGFWRIDFVSPDLSGDSNWQNVKGVTASVSFIGPYVADPEETLNIQFVLKMKTSGTLHILKPNLHKMNKDYFEKWEHLKAQNAAPITGLVQELRVKVYGTSKKGVYPPMAWVALDAITPFK
jgi:hypothetical protein